MVGNRLVVARLLAAGVFSIALAVTGCSSDEEPGGTGGMGDGGGGGTAGDGGGAGTGGGGEGGDAGGGGMPPQGAVTADPAGTGFEDPLQVTLSTDGSDPIYYTTDLSPVLSEDGTVQGTEYTGPVTITETTVLKFLTGTEGSFTSEQSEGYVFNNTPIRAQWAESGHGAVAAESWRHWDADGAVPSRCAKCHGPQANGYVGPDVGFLEYVATSDNVADAPLPLGLDCVSCHQTFPTIYSNLAKFGLPDGGLEPVVFPSTDAVSLYGPSNICMVCHQGRESGKDVQETIDADDGAGPYSFLNIHFYAAAASAFGSETWGGYEYPSQSYRPRNTFPSHPDSFSTCVGCHMTNASDGDVHTWDPSLESCQTCHGGDSFETLGGTPSQSYTALQALAPELYAEIQEYATNVIGKPILYADGYPYFFNDNGQGASFPNRYTDFDATLLPAAYNYQVLQKDPAGFVHNGTYLQQLAFDSIVSLGGTPSVNVLDRGELTIDGDDIGTASKTLQWQISAHGALDTEPFRHWDEDYEADGYTPSGVPSFCSRCHTTGAFTEYAAGDPTSGQLPRTGVDCWACHNNFNLYEDPETRWDDLGSNPALEDIVFPSGATASLGNASNMCMGCHQGRSSKVQVDAATPNDVDQTPTNYDSYDFINIHYYAAGATLFGSDVQGGYEYDQDTAGDPLDYRGQTNFAGIHVGADIGRNLVDCVGCHMDSSLARNPPAPEDTGKHTFLPVVEDCNFCHAGDDFEDMSGTPGINYANIEILKEDLLAAIQDYGENGLPQSSELFYNGSSYPYWFNEGGPAAFPNRYRDFDFDMLTAAYNFVTADKDPGGYIHNGAYIQQLLFDSICRMGGTPRVLTVTGRPSTCPTP